MTFLEQAEKRLGKNVVAHQRKVFDLIASEYLPEFEVVDGMVISSVKNDSLIAKLDNLFAKLEKAIYRDVIGPFAADLLKSADLSGRYYQGLGFKKSVIDGLLKNKVRLEAKIGITPTGKLRKNSYLYKLGQTAEVRQKLLSYTVNSLTGGTSFLDFQLGMRNLVLGNKRQKSLATTGSLERYFDQYAYDTFNDMDAVANKQLATNLGLEHFIYEGSVIKTTRAFCRNKAGKAFKVVDAVAKWPNDPDLVDKKTKASYNPLIERGRYRCRHFIKYITEELYNQLIAGLI